MENKVISTHDMCKTFISSGVEFHAIRNLSLDIYEQDFTVIMGSSGSGKSTLLYLLSGLDGATSGTVWFEETRIDNLQENKLAKMRRNKVGFVFQSINLAPNLSIYENITVPGYLSQKNRREVEKRALELLRLMGIEQEKDRMPSQVSGGQQQRTAIARAMINNPKVLFADEPTGALNSTNGENVLDILSDINSQGQTIVMVTHDIKAACRANRILYIRDGRIDGELTLEKYSKESFGDREQQIFYFLKNKGW
ncbi:MAG TPA: ABC transporter ATP-binding protein [Desulfobacteria bacterium]|nr:ABC transporter ATP-binding protein [Desulfobacteria bacterium]